MNSNQFERSILEGLGERWGGGQAVVVRALSVSGHEAEMTLFEQAGGVWRIAAGPWQAVLGKNGVGKRVEGDGMSPSGVFLFGPAFGSAEPPAGLRYPYSILSGQDRWIDDPASPFYNRWVRGPQSVCGGGEELASIAQYRHAVALHFNAEAVSGAGSAVFVHAWEGPGFGTSGCTAVSEEHLRELLLWLDYENRPVLVQGTDAQIGRLMGENWNMLCLPKGWGLIDDFIPEAQLEIRYATRENFTGRVLPAYFAPAAPMRLEALRALAACAGELREVGLGMRIFDAYRPQQATDAMIAWAMNASDVSRKAEYYPDIDKQAIPDNFVARRSNHRLGGTVDLTLLNWSDGADLDMGGTFDFFGRRSAFGFDGLTPGQAANRALLQEGMVRHGFTPLEKEWWHFAHPVDGDGGEFAILPLERVMHET